MANSEFQFSGGEKAAAMFLLMGKEPAAKLAGFFSKDELNIVIDAAKALPGIDLAAMEALVEEFRQNYSTHGLSAGSPELANILNGEERAKTGTTDKNKSIADASGGANLDPQLVSLFFENEPAQISAVLIDRLDDDLVVEVFRDLDPGLRNSIFQAYLDNNSLTPQMQELFETELLQVISETEIKSENQLDVTKAARLINQFPADTSDDIVAHIESSRPQIAEAIKKSLFKFSAVPHLSKEDRSKLFDGVSSDDLVQALAQEDEAGCECVLEVLSPRNRRMVESELARSQTGDEDCEKAQKIIAIRALKLSQSGDITLPEPS